jgi:hypothetical protein
VNSHTGAYVRVTSRKFRGKRFFRSISYTTGILKECDLLCAGMECCYSQSAVATITLGLFITGLE